MADAIPDQWPDDIKVEVRSPVSILRFQASRLGERTQRLLEGDVTVTEGGPDNDTVVASLFLVAPALKNYRRELLSAKYDRGMPYPVIVEADCFEQGGSLFQRLEMNEDVLTDINRLNRKASSEQEFLAIIGKVLRSSETKSIINSLLARINDESRPEKASA